MRSADYIESTYQYESTDVQMRNGKAVRARLPDVKMTCTPAHAVSREMGALARGAAR